MLHVDEYRKSVAENRSQLDRPGASHGTFCLLFYTATLVAMQYFQYSYIYAHFDVNNLNKLMDSIGLTLDFTLALLKLLSRWLNRR